MRRSSEQRPIGLRAWAVSLVLVMGGAWAVFHFVDPHRLAGRWPFGVDRTEVDAYAAVAVLPFAEKDSVRVPVLYLGPTRRSGSCWPADRGRGRDTRWMETNGFGDSVDVRPLRSEADGLHVRLRPGSELRGQRSFTLRPATDELLRARFVQLLATELEVLAPELSLIRVISCGKDLGIHVKEEVPDGHFLARHGVSGATAIELVFDPRLGHDLVPRVKGDSLANERLRALWSSSGRHGDAVGVGAWSHWSLLRMLASPDDPWGGEHPSAFMATEQQLIPVFRAPRPDLRGPARTMRSGPVTALVGTEPFVRSFRAAQDRLTTKRGELRERLLLVATTWVPMLHTGEAVHVHMARAEALIDELLRSLQDRELVGRLGLPVEPWPGYALLASEHAPLLSGSEVQEADALAELRRTTKLVVEGDSVVFPRGKYRINGALRFPQGHRVILLPGARIELGADAQLQVRGPLEVRGTKLNPVFVRPAEKGMPHQGLDVVGGAGDAAHISGLQMSGGRADRALVRMQGMAQVVVQGSVLEGASGGTLLHVLGGEVELRGGMMQGGAVQLTQTKALLKDVLLRGAARGRGAGGVVVEGGLVRIEGGATMGQEGAGVRCSSAAKVLLLGAVIDGCAIGLEVRDGATVHVDDVRFRKNDLVFSVSSAGSVRGSSRVVLYRNSFQDNGRDREVDADSSVNEVGTLMEAVRSGERFIP
ncbi:MAG: hypothetical protein R2817_00285 [Flavobacteriales bacterium]